MNKHHIPGGNSFNLVFVNNLMFEMDLTRAELFDLATDPGVKKIHTPRFDVKDWLKWRGNVAGEFMYFGIWTQICWANQWLE